MVAQTVTQASLGGGLMKEDRMDVEPCYPLFSAELESAETLASSQQKFQTLVCHPTCLGSKVSNSDWMSDIICELKFSRLQWMKK